jgi:hypothetical protein
LDVQHIRKEAHLYHTTRGTFLQKTTDTTAAADSALLMQFVLLLPSPSSKAPTHSRIASGSSSSDRGGGEQHSERLANWTDCTQLQAESEIF